MNLLEARNIYENYCKKGKSTYSSRISNGESGYLPVLAGIVNNAEIVSEIKIGIKEIPLKKIIGTSTSARSASFTHGFMPLLSADSEFGSKWCSLYCTHIEEGIVDPIQVYEYLNWFYVIEGNKRVSVLKCVDALSIRAEVIRMIPKWDQNNKMVRLYYQFMAFNNKTDIFTIWFTEEGSYDELKAYMDKYESNLIDDKDNKYKCFEDWVYLPFETVYKEISEDNSRFTTGDVFLKYLKLQGIPERSLPKKELKRQIKALVKDEFSQEPAPGILANEVKETKIKGLPKSEIIKAAFVYRATEDNSSWIAAHELGRKYIEKRFKGQIKTTIREHVPIKDSSTIRQLAQEGNNVIFTTSIEYWDILQQVGCEFPHTYFLNCSSENVEVKCQNTSRYFGRMYEARYLTGIIAGAMTKSCRVGYVASKPIPGFMRGINAFALGVKSVNPHAKVLVEWVNDWFNPVKERWAAENLSNKGIDVMTVHIDSAEAWNICMDKGIYYIGHNKDISTESPYYLTSSIWNWGVFYERVIQNVSSGAWDFFFNMFNTSPRLEYSLWGMNTHLVGLGSLSKSINPHVKNLVEAVRNMMVRKQFYPFMGPVYSNKGELKLINEEIADDQAMLTMDWLVDNVVASTLR